MTPDEINQAITDLKDVPMLQSGKRCAVRWTAWRGDWFTSWSPRSGRPEAAGPWDHWVDLAVRILRDPLTAKIHPEAHALAQQLQPVDMYDEANRDLTVKELRERFTTGES